MTSRLLLLLATYAVGFAAATGVAPCAAADDAPKISPDQEKHFEEKVRPVLASKCFSCHGAEKQENGLRLDSREGILKGGVTGTPMIRKDNPAAGGLLSAIRHEGDVQMPPDGKLSDVEITAISEWVAMDLPWPKRDGASAAMSREDQYAQIKSTHWSLQPIGSPALPAVSSPAWPETSLDYFILQKLDEAQLAPSPEANRVTLARRWSIDLIGLPPTMEEVESFVADARPGAEARYVDRLLASPAYGERWGRHWLDLARYGDTKGYAFAQDRRYPYAYTYRDYVIRALNADVPYDQFVREQLAADLLPDNQDPKRLAALGFLTTGRKFNDRHADIDDQIDVTSRGLMGITVSCAKCHDHKYDAVPAEDYYSLYGVFASSSEPAELPLIAAPEQVSGYAEFAAKQSELKAQVEKHRDEVFAKTQQAARERVGGYLIRAATNADEEIVLKLPFILLSREETKRRIAGAWKAFLGNQKQTEHSIWGPWAQIAALNDEKLAMESAAIREAWKARGEGLENGQLNPRLKAVLASQLDGYITEAGAIPQALRVAVARAYGVAISEAWKAQEAAGGVDKVDPATKQLVEVLTADGSPSKLARDRINEYYTRAEREEERRLQTEVQKFEASSPVAPPRAMVVKEQPQPMNPVVFLRGNPARPGKAVPRQFLWVIAGNERQPFKTGSGRLELAEAVVSRDNPLTARVLVNRVWMHHFGEPLVDTPGDFGIRCPKPLQAELLDHLATTLIESGWSLKELHREIVLSRTYRQQSVVRPDCAAIDPENRRLWKMNRRRLEFEATRDALLWASGKLDTAQFGRAVEIANPPFSNRRTVYGAIDRQDLPNLFRNFDFPNPDQSADKRAKTSVPQQGLFLLNSPFVIEQAKALAARCGGADEEKLISLYRILFTRSPTPEEFSAAKEFLAVTTADASPRKLEPIEQLAQVLMLTSEYLFVD
jgi:mono/diheme cytochrome c family protein